MAVPYFQEILDNYAAFQWCTQEFCSGGGGFNKFS